ncbi:MAG: hypothetical protein JSU00_28125 [Acidobacteria bacterium]|nr:hypothetical protein [Acidobacteriota bacterium]
MVEKALEILLFTLGGLYHGLSQDWNALELAILAVFALVVRRGRAPSPRWLRIETWLAGFARRRGAVCWAAGVAAVAVRAALIPVFPPPAPVVTDEFSHLLLADTLLHGRVANPSPAEWEHFESLHILVRPVYVSNYFPGQGAILAAARWATGSPWVGVLLLSGAFAVALCWSLQGWMPARWALAGTVIAILRFSIGSYWVNAFHGGFLAAFGGALAAGAFARLRRRPGARMSFVLGVGLAVLAYSRPYEGLFFAAPFVVILAFRPGRLTALGPAAVLAVLALVPLLLYFRAITGSPFSTAYNLSRQQYGWPMTFAWAKPPEIRHTNPELKFYYEYEIDERMKVSSPLLFIQYLTFRLQEYWRFFLGPLLTACLAWSGWVFRSRRYLALLAGAGGAFVAVMMEGAASPHYLSPATTALVAIVTLAMWRMRERWRHGPALSRIVLAGMVVVLAGRIALQAGGLPYTQKVNFQSWCCKAAGRPDKAEFAEAIGKEPGMHLVLVRAKTDPYNFFQWIYNEADLDRARIVWARDLGDERNRALLEYYKDRTIWLVDPNPSRAVLKRLN